MNHPEIHVKDWIDVGNRECVVLVGKVKSGTSCPAMTLVAMQMSMIPVYVN